jgi:hypothetical protein
MVVAGTVEHPDGESNRPLGRPGTFCMSGNSAGITTEYGSRTTPKSSVQTSRRRGPTSVKQTRFGVNFSETA